MPLSALGELTRRLETIDPAEELMDLATNDLLALRAYAQQQREGVRDWTPFLATVSEGAAMMLSELFTTVTAQAFGNRVPVTCNDYLSHFLNREQDGVRKIFSSNFGFVTGGLAGSVTASTLVNSLLRSIKAPRYIPIDPQVLVPDAIYTNTPADQALKVRLRALVKKKQKEILSTSLAPINVLCLNGPIIARSYSTFLSSAPAWCAGLAQSMLIGAGVGVSERGMTANRAALQLPVSAADGQGRRAADSLPLFYPTRNYQTDQTVGSLLGSNNARMRSIALRLGALLVLSITFSYLNHLLCDVYKQSYFYQMRRHGGLLNISDDSSLPRVQGMARAAVKNMALPFRHPHNILDAYLLLVTICIYSLLSILPIFVYYRLMGEANFESLCRAIRRVVNNLEEAV